MRLKQQLVIKKDENAKKAIEAHAGFITCILGHVRKNGIKAVLSAKSDSELGWVKTGYKRVLEFAEMAYLKQIPSKIEGEFKHSGKIEINKEQYQERVSRILKYANESGSNN